MWQAKCGLVGDERARLQREYLDFEHDRGGDVVRLRSLHATVGGEERAGERERERERDGDRDRAGNMVRCGWKPGGGDRGGGRGG